MTPDGQPAPGNPFGTLVWTYGHRNVQGLVFDRAGRLWASEFGQNRFDEINLIQAGKDYGWPIVEGASDDPRFTAPLVTWPTSDASPSGVTIAGSTLYVAALRGERLWQVPLEGDRTGTPRATLRGRVRPAARGAARAGRVAVDPHLQPGRPRRPDRRRRPDPAADRLDPGPVGRFRHMPDFSAAALSVNGHRAFADRRRMGSRAGCRGPRHGEAR